MEHLITFGVTTFLVVMAAIFSGLNISIMSLSLNDLKRKARLGNKDAKKVLPLRTNAYLTLSSILFANVAVVSMSTLTLESAFNGLVAGIATTILMVIFGEVVPQVVFVRSALKFCSLFTPLIKLVTFVTYPLSKPLAMALDRFVGREEITLHTRAELGLLISEHKIADESELDEDEVEIIQSALQLSEKTVKDIMQPIKEVYWLTEDATLDAKTVDEITANGYSRVPIFDKKLTQCHGVLLMKDMVDIDFDEHPVPVTHFHLHKTRLVGSRTALDTMFRKLGVIRSHLIPIEQNDKIIGIITAEDLIEEIIGHEIADETDHALHRP
jgi:metal transporter CNNM